LQLNMRETLNLLQPELQVLSPKEMFGALDAMKTKDARFKNVVHDLKQVDTYYRGIRPAVVPFAVDEDTVESPLLALPFAEAVFAGSNAAAADDDDDGDDDSAKKNSSVLPESYSVTHKFDIAKKFAALRQAELLFTGHKIGVKRASA